MQELINEFCAFFSHTGFAGFFNGTVTLQMVAMWVISAILLYMAVAKGFEPLLLVPIAFGALLANLPDKSPLAKEDATGMLVTKVRMEKEDPQTKEKSSFVETMFLRAIVSDMPEETKELQDKEELTQGQKIQRIDGIKGGLFDILGQGIKAEIFPPIIFLGVGALTDFGPLIANPRTLLLGAAAQLGVAATFFMSLFLGFTKNEAASIGIIGGADGPTSIFLTNALAPHLLGAVAVAAYTYMALVPLIQPPIMRLLTTKKERLIRMPALRSVSRSEKLIFSCLVAIFVIMLIPDAAALVGMLMLGNFLRECQVCERLVQSAQNEIINITTIFLGTSVGLTMQGERFLQWQTIKIISLGIVAFAVATAGGVITAKLMNLVPGWRKRPINPLIGSAGVSAVPMAARVSQVEGQKYDPSNFLLMHAMGPNVAGVIGTAVIAGYYIATLKH